jgi:hypothetical protein
VRREWLPEKHPTEDLAQAASIESVDSGKVVMRPGSAARAWGALLRGKIRLAAPVAQWIERSPPKGQVARSIRAGGAKRIAIGTNGVEAGSLRARRSGADTLISSATGGFKPETRRNKMINYGYNGLIGILILAGDIWAIINILQSSVSNEKKLLWIIVVLLLPVLGLILWYFLGPRDGKV